MTETTPVSGNLGTVEERLARFNDLQNQNTGLRIVRDDASSKPSLFMQIADKNTGDVKGQVFQFGNYSSIQIGKEICTDNDGDGKLDKCY